MDARCQCGAVTFKTPTPKPLALYICHCDACKRQTGSAFGTSAIFPRFSLPEAEHLGCYKRPIASGHVLHCYFCRLCGTRLIHTTPSKNVISVKGGCLEGLDWTTAIHLWTKSAMVPIPERAEQYAGEHDASSDGSGASIAADQEVLDQPGYDAGDHADLAGSGGSCPADPVRAACELSG